jgi:hypothetical protein
VRSLGRLNSVAALDRRISILDTFLSTDRPNVVLIRLCFLVLLPLFFFLFCFETERLEVEDVESDEVDEESESESLLVDIASSFLTWVVGLAASVVVTWYADVASKAGVRSNIDLFSSSGRVDKKWRSLSYPDVVGSVVVV